MDALIRVDQGVHSSNWLLHHMKVHRFIHNFC